MAKITFAHVVRFVLKPPFGVMFWPHAVFVSRGLTEHMNALGVAYGPLIFLHPAYKQYEGLLLHEQQHVKQWWHCVAISFLVFLLIKYLVGGVIGWQLLLFFSMFTFNLLLRGKMFGGLGAGEFGGFFGWLGRGGSGWFGTHRRFFRQIYTTCLIKNA